LLCEQRNSFLFLFIQERIGFAEGFCDIKIRILANRWQSQLSEQAGKDTRESVQVLRPFFTFWHASNGCFCCAEGFADLLAGRNDLAGYLSIHG